MALEGILKYPCIFFIGLLAALLMTPLAIRLALRLGMVDRPDARRVHKQPTPRGGGLAVVFAFHAACAAIFLLPWRTFIGGLTFEWWVKFLPLSVALAAIGFIDDFRGMRPWWKLGGQTAVAVVAWVIGLRVESFFGLPLPDWADLLLTVFWFLAMINAFNLIDGLDGLAAGLGSIAAAGLAGSFFLRNLPADCLVALGLMGACLGFLHYNFHPARVFLGDVGSMFIGFAFGAISLTTSTKGTTFAALVVPLLAVGVPLFDTFLAVWRRSARKILSRIGKSDSTKSGMQVFGADLDHLHHRLHSAGQSQRSVTGVLYVAASVLVGVGLLAMAFQDLAGGIYLMAFVAAVYVVVRHVAHVELWDSASALVHGLSRPIQRAIVVPAYIAVDVLILVLSQIIASAVSGGGFNVSDWRRGILNDVVFEVGLPFLALAASGMYRRVWSQARIMDFVYLTAALAGGLAVGLAILMIADAEATRQHVFESFVLFYLALPMLVGVRVFRRIAADLRSSVVIRGHRDAPGTKEVLVYGAGHMGMLFLNAEVGHAAGSGEWYRVIGFLDDDTNFHGRIVHGYPVIGGIESLETLLPETGADAVVVTADLSPESYSRLLRAARMHGIEVLHWGTFLQPMEASEAALKAMVAER